MKDKLTKHGRKSSYFVWRKVFIVFLAILGLCATVAIPVVITIASVKAASPNHISLIINK